jgi:hypothetical protein
MKAFSVLLLSLIVSNAHASSWIETKCSNSDGSVTWSNGSDEAQISLKYANFVEGTLTLGVDQVNIQITDGVTIKNRSIKECSYVASQKVYAGKVKIIAADKHPDVLRSQFPENKITTEVICTTITHEKRPCNK